MKVSVFGLGYVGAVSAACLAKCGHQVIGVDVNAGKVAAIAAGRSSVVEPGLDELVHAAVAAGRLSATTDAEQAVLATDVSLICVGTPSNGNGSLGLQYIENVARQIGAALRRAAQYHVVVVRSTVLPGTVEEHLVPILEETSGRRAGRDFGVSMNPEFLRESSAVEDYFHPSQIVIGEWDARSGEVVQKLYAGIEAEVVRTGVRAAEMVKYVNNAFHALKIAFANEIGNLCKAHGIDGREVMRIFCQDRRLNISPAYLRPGYAFGGSCLPKDLRALAHRAKRSDVECPLLSAAIESNTQQIARGIELVERTGRKRIGVLGLSFKAGTDDVRESPAVPLIETLLGRGYEVAVYDEHVRPERLIGANKAYLVRELPHIASLMRESLDEVMAEAEVLVIAHDAKAFRQAPEMARRDQIVIDLVGTCHVNGHAKENYEGICW